MGATGATATANAVVMGTTANVRAALPVDATDAAVADGTGTSTVVVSNGAGSVGEPRATGTSTSTAAIVGTTNSGTACTTGKASQEYPEENQASISLTTPKANLAKDIDKNPTQNQRRILAHLHIFLLQDSTDLTQLNDAKNMPFTGIINIPKSSTIRVVHSFGVETNPIGGSFPIAGKILSLVVDGSSYNPPHSMVFPR